MMNPMMMHASRMRCECEMRNHDSEILFPFLITDHQINMQLLKENTKLLVNKTLGSESILDTL